MEKREDRRITKTRELLWTALAQLLKKKSLNKITVKELVDKAGINRSTFYLHYSDVAELVQEIEAELLSEMQEAVKKHPMELSSHTTEDFFEDVFQVLENHREIGCAFLGENGDLRFVREIEIFLEDCSRSILMEMSPDSSGKLKYFYSFCMHGCLGFVRTWLESGEEMTYQEAAEMAFLMVSNAMDAFCLTAGKE